MDLEKLKRLREENFLKHKKKKRAYYLKSKNKEAKPKYKNYKEIDYSKELNDENFLANMKLIAKKQKGHIDNRIEQITKKIKVYKKQKKEYYEENKKERLNYDKEYRERKKEQLKEYRREYYRKNREKILAKQKEKRNKNKE